MAFGARLKEERKRLGLKQAEFAARVGTDMPRQSLYERGQRQLRADYLAAIAAAGVDVIYVLTGRRGIGAPLGDDAGAFIAAYLALPEVLREPVERFVGKLTERAGEGRSGRR